MKGSLGTQKADHSRLGNSRKGEGVGERGCPRERERGLSHSCTQGSLGRAARSQAMPQTDYKAISGVGPTHWDFGKLACHFNVQPKLRIFALKHKNKKPKP